MLMNEIDYTNIVCQSSESGCFMLHVSLIQRVFCFRAIVYLAYYHHQRDMRRMCLSIGTLE